MGTDMARENLTPCLVRPRPLPFESLPGYVLRVSELNGYVENSWLFRIFFKTPFYFSLSTHGLNKMSELFWVEPEELGAMAFKTVGVFYQQQIVYGSHYFLRSHLRKRSVAICPECLKDHPIASLKWDFSTITACTAHGNWLTDACPKCGHYLQWRRPGICKCSCGFDLRNGPVTPAPGLVVSLMRVIENALFEKSVHCAPDTKMFGDEVNELTFSEWAYFQEVVQSIFFKSQLNKESEQPLGTKEFQSACYASITMAYTLKVWPNNVIKLLRHAQKERRGKSPSLIMSYSDLETRCGRVQANVDRNTFSYHSLPKFIQNAICQYIAHGIWNEGQEKLCLNPNKLRCHFTGDLHLSATKATKALFKRYGHKTHPFYGEEISVEEFIYKKEQVTKRSFGVIETQLVLKCSRSHILQIKPYIAALELPERYCAERVSELIASLNSVAKLSGERSVRKPDRLIALNQIKTAIYPFKKIVNAILAKRLCLYRSPTAENFSHFFVSLNDLHQFCQGTDMFYQGKTENVTRTARGDIFRKCQRICITAK